VGSWVLVVWALSAFGVGSFMCVGGESCVNPYFQYTL